MEALLLEGNKAAFIEDGFQGVVAYSAVDKIFYGKVQSLEFLQRQKKLLKLKMKINLEKEVKYGTC